MLLTTQCAPIDIKPIEKPLESISGAKNDIQGYAKTKVLATFGLGQWESFYNIVRNESGWNWQAVNKSSGACGLGQALPCSKMGELGHTDTGQVEWVINYISERYGTPNEAWNFWQAHNWY